MSDQTILRSGQELRLAAFLSQDKTLLDAYAHNKDAYAIIASQVFNVPYEECLEFYPEGTELEIDGKKVIAGTGKEYFVEADDNNSITVKYYALLETESGDKAAKDVLLSDKLMSDSGFVCLKNKLTSGSDITFVFN